MANERFKRTNIVEHVIAVSAMEEYLVRESEHTDEFQVWHRKLRNKHNTRHSMTLVEENAGTLRKAEKAVRREVKLRKQEIAGAKS